MKSQPRAYHEQTREELRRILDQIYAEGTFSVLNKQNTLESIRAHGQLTARNDFLIDASSKQIIAIIHDQNGSAVCGLQVDFARPVAAAAIRYGRFLTKTFSDDLKAANDFLRHKELWTSLQHTRHSRAIGKLCPFHTPLFIKWLRMFEAASSLRYEGNYFSARLVLTKRIKWINNNTALSFIKFDRPMPLAVILFEEKWARALTYNQNISLVGLGHDQGIAGMFSVSDHAAKPSPSIFAPHQNLDGWCSALVPGTVGFVTSPIGDLYLVFADGLSFVKSQGYWRLAAGTSLRDVLAEDLPGEMATVLARVAFDLSYEGNGALLCIMFNIGNIKEIVPDHNGKNIANETLRKTSRHLHLSERGHISMIKAAATVDGAVLIDKTGSIHDVACMIGDPSPSALAAIGLTDRARHPGARTTAAWNASVYGTSVKISEDGPITVFRNGVRILQTG
jgi:hypothetical protein